MRDRPASTQSNNNGANYGDNSVSHTDLLVGALYDVRDAVRDLGTELRADMRGLRWDLRFSLGGAFLLIFLVLAAVFGFKLGVTTPFMSVETQPGVDAPLPPLEIP